MAAIYPTVPEGQAQGTGKMGLINPAFLKMTIEAILVLTEENVSSWKTCICALFQLGGVKKQMLDGTPELEDDDNTILYATILAKLSALAHSKVVNSSNKSNAQVLWKSIMKRFMSPEPLNQARV